MSEEDKRVSFLGGKIRLGWKRGELGGDDWWGSCGFGVGVRFS